MSRVYLGIDPGWRNIGICALFRASATQTKLSVLKADTLDTSDKDKPIKKLSSKDYENLHTRLAVFSCTWLDMLWKENPHIFVDLGRVELCIEEPFYNPRLPFMRKLFHIKYFLQGVVNAWFWQLGVVTVTKSTQMSTIQKKYQLAGKRDHQKLVQSAVNTRDLLHTEHEHDAALHCLYTYDEESNLVYPKKE